MSQLRIDSRSQKFSEADAAKEAETVHQFVPEIDIESEEYSLINLKHVQQFRLDSERWRIGELGDYELPEHNHHFGDEIKASFDHPWKYIQNPKRKYTQNKLPIKFKDEVYEVELEYEAKAKLQNSAREGVDSKKSSEVPTILSIFPGDSSTTPGSSSGDTARDTKTPTSDFDDPKARRKAKDTGSRPRLLQVYSPSYQFKAGSEISICKRNRAKLVPFHRPDCFRFLVDPVRFTLSFSSAPIEPFWFEIALFDVGARMKISESFFFSFNTEPVLRKLQKNRSSLDTIAHSNRALFSISRPNKDLWIFLKVHKVLQGALSGAIDAYSKDHPSAKDLQKTELNCDDFCTRLGRFNQTFLWSCSPLFNSESGDFRGDHINFPDLFAPLDPSEPFSEEVIYRNIEDVRDRSSNYRSFVRISGEFRISIYQLPASYDQVLTLIPNAIVLAPTLQPLAQSVNVVLDPILHKDDEKETKSVDRDETPPLPEDTNMLSTSVRGQGRFSRAVSNLSLTFVSPNAKVPPSADECKRTNFGDFHLSNIIRELYDFSFSDVPVPEVSFSNILFIYPQSVYFKDYRNVTVKIEVKNDDMSLDTEGECCFFGRADGKHLQNYVFTSVTHHASKNNHAWSDEFKVELPNMLRPKHHFFFTFYDVPCQKKKAVDLKVIGYSVLPIFPDQRLVDLYYTLPVFDPKSFSSEYLSFALSSASVSSRFDIYKHNFSIKLFALSSIYTSDPYLSKFYHECLIRPDQLETDPILPNYAKLLREQEREKVYSLLKMQSTTSYDAGATSTSSFHVSSESMDTTGRTKASLSMWSADSVDPFEKDRKVNANIGIENKEMYFADRELSNKFARNQVHAGVLELFQGTVMKAWHSRWFILSGNQLSYYYSSQDKNAEGFISLDPDGEIDITHRATDDRHKFTFYCKNPFTLEEKAQLGITERRERLYNEETDDLPEFFLCGLQNMDRLSWLQSLIHSKIRNWDTCHSILGIQHARSTLVIKNLNAIFRMLFKVICYGNHYEEADANASQEGPPVSSIEKDKTLFTCVPANSSSSMYVKKCRACGFHSLLAVCAVCEEGYERQPGDSERCPIIDSFVTFCFDDFFLDEPCRWVYESVISLWLSLYHGGNEWNEAIKTKELAVRYAWFLFDLIVKSMMLQVAREGKLSATPQGSFVKPEVRAALVDLIREITRQIHTTSALNAAKHANKNLALFVSDLFSILERSFVFELIASYLHKTEEVAGSGQPEGRAIVREENRYLFLQIINDNEQYVSLNAPIKLSGPAKILLDQIEDRQRHECELEEIKIFGDEATETLSTFIMQKQKSRPVNFLSHMFICQVIDSLSQPSTNEVVWACATNSIRDLMIKHEFDAFFQNPKIASSFCTMFLPLVTKLWGKIQVMKKNVGEDARRALLCCVLYILSNVPAEVSLKYFREHAERDTQAATRRSVLRNFTLFVDLLCECQELFQYTRESSCVILSGAEGGYGFSARGVLEQNYQKFPLSGRANVTNLNVVDLRAQRAQRAQSSQPLGIPLHPKDSSVKATSTVGQQLKARAQVLQGTLGKHQAIDKSFQKNYRRWERVFTSEVSEVLLDILMNCVVATVTNPEYFLIGKEDAQDKLMEFLLRFLTFQASEDVLIRYFDIVSLLLKKYAAYLFEQRASRNEFVRERCEKWWTRLLLCNSYQTKTTSEASRRVIYEILYRNYMRVGSLTRIRKPLIEAFSKVYQMITWSDQSWIPDLALSNLSNSVTALSKRAKLEESGARKSPALFACTMQIKDLFNKLATMIDLHNEVSKIEDFQHNEERADTYYHLVELYENSPDMQIVFLKKLDDLNRLEKSSAEAAACQYLQGKKKMNMKYAETPEGVQDIIQHFRASSLLYQTAEMHERAIELETMLADFFLKRNDHRQVVDCYEEILKLRKTLAAFQEEGDNRMWSSYYRIGFFGNAFGPKMNGKEFVYKLPGLTQLAEIKLKLCETWSKTLNTTVTMFKDSNPVDLEKFLEKGETKIQFTAVSPYFDDEKHVKRSTVYQLNNNIRAFFFETPFTTSGKAHSNNISEQYKRKTILYVPEPYPCARKRQPVQLKSDFVLNPIEVCISDIRKRIHHLRAECYPDVGVPELRSMTQVLSGSVAPTVHGGAGDVVETFLSPENESKYDSGHVGILRNVLVEFLGWCKDALTISKKLVVTEGDEKFQEELERRYTALYEQCRVPLALKD